MLSLRLGVSTIALMQAAALASTWLSPGAVADYDFRNDRYFGPTLTTSRASVGYVDDSAGNWSLVPANRLRRSDKGALIEGAQTNSIRNNSMQGAVAGSLGTLPTYWQLTFPAGLTRTLTIENVQGVEILRVRLQGTTTAAGAIQLLTETNSSIPADKNQLWTNSSFFQQINITGLAATGTAWKLEEWEYGASSNFLATGSGLTIPFAVGATLTRLAISRSLPNASTAFVLPILRTDNIPSGTVCDIEFRIGWPQLERWDTTITTVGGASSPIRTTGAAATRAADLVNAPVSGLTAADTLVAVGRAAIDLNAGANASIAALTDGTLSNRTSLFRFASTGAMTAFTTAGGGISLNNSVVPAGQRFAAASAQQISDFAVSISGGAMATAAPTGAYPAGLNTLAVGHNGATGGQWYGYVERLSVYLYRASNTDLQRLSTLAA